MNKLFFIEGLWGTGKTRICLYLKKEFRFYYIKELNHIKGGLSGKSRKNITHWYLKEHIKNLNKGLDLLSAGRNVIIERSPISSVAFINTFFSKDNSFDLKVSYFEELLKGLQQAPHVVYIESVNIGKLARHMKGVPYIFDYANLHLLRMLNSNFVNYMSKLKKKRLIKLTKVKSDISPEGFKKTIQINKYEN